MRNNSLLPKQQTILHNQLPNKIDQQDRQLIRNLWLQGYSPKVIEQQLQGKIKRRTISWHIEKLERETETSWHKGLLGKYVTLYNKFSAIAEQQISDIVEEMEKKKDNPKLVIALRTQLREYMEFVHKLLGDGPTVQAVRKLKQQQAMGQ